MPKLGRRSERTELDYQVEDALVTKEAPFGTEDTPVLKEKIIGSKRVCVLERPGGQMYPRYETLSLVSDKPNHIDPRALKDFSRRYNKPYKDPFHKGHLRVYPKNIVTKRPDSKDISRRYGVLPPIDENRLRNHIVSTVFEPEAWTPEHYTTRKIYTPCLADMSLEHIHECKKYDNLSSRRYSESVVDRKNGWSPKAQLLTDNKELSRHSNTAFLSLLLERLPNNAYLPSVALTVSEDDEVRLLELIGEELRHLDSLKLRDIYKDVVRHADKTLSSICHYQDLAYSCRKHVLDLHVVLMRVLAAMFVSKDYSYGHVDYEKFLSFIGVALRKRDEKKAEPLSRPKTPVEQLVDSYLADTAQMKLISTIKQELDQNDFVIDFGRLHRELLLRDRNGNGILDYKSIADACFQLNLPLQTSILKRCLQKCRQRNYVDAYNWKRFMEILREAQPQSGRQAASRNLPIGSTLSPASNHVNVAQKCSDSPAERSPEVIPGDPRRSSYHDLPCPNTDGHEDHCNITGNLSRMDNDINRLELEYKKIKDTMRSTSQSAWMNKFMELASSLYRQDDKCEGELPQDEVLRWTKMYSETCNLGIQDHHISRAIAEASKNNKVNIHHFLAKLGNVSHTDKIV